MSIKLCECGCGREVKNRYINGHSFRGKNHSIKTRETLSAIKLGKSAWWIIKGLDNPIKNPIVVQQMAETRKRLFKENKMFNYVNPMKDKKHTEKTKRKISEAVSGKKNGMFNKHHSQKVKEESYKRRLNIVIPSKDSKPELKLQQALTSLNIPFKKHVSILGQPDIFIEPNICIFVDGCYWHGCEQCLDKNKFTGYHRAKIVRDQFVTQGLINQGYVVLRFWEHKINHNIEDIIGNIKISIGV